MLFRFSLYGFLKNQRYFEAFLMLVFIDKGLSFFQIGLLIGFRELMVNLFEIPSGAIADMWGRRKSMIFSFTCYCLSFLAFGLAESVVALFAAMFVFALGEAFRTGTHKAMIFAWLESEGRTGERAKVYGYTRSWSKYGSAVSVVLGACFVFASDSYTSVFYYSIVPYMLGIVNFLGYPRALDGRVDEDISLKSLISHLRQGFKEAFGRGGLRRLIVESMGFQAISETAQTYLQPVLKMAAIAVVGGWVITAGWSEIQRTTLLVGPVYMVLYLLAALASRNAHRIIGWTGDEERAARWLWWMQVPIFAVMALAAYYSLAPLLIATFVLLYALQNCWRPVQLARLDTYGRSAQGATLLSIESQAMHGATVVAAPLLGWVVDAVVARELGGPFWPVGILGVVVASAFAIASLRRQS